MANDVNEYGNEILYPDDRGGGIWEPREESIGRKSVYNNQNNNNFFTGFNRDVDYSKHPNQSNGYNPHQRQFNQSKFDRFNPIGTGHNPRLDYGINKQQH